ncbi:hypothetical protein F4808DRAFT_462578 [Astrocystis sublimbata]|nr:hypothetical protein F4808DRAFT_466100 [Astrocystis sublimbata]KAI0198640.1 hypothetical protein F4808DRAFT_462578 [Astrocystis sublimbata]
MTRKIRKMDAKDAERIARSRGVNDSFSRRATISARNNYQTSQNNEQAHSSGSGSGSGGASESQNKDEKKSSKSEKGQDSR